MLCEDKDCMFKYKTYGTSGSGIKPHQCKLNVHIASYIISEYGVDTCEIGCCSETLSEEPMHKKIIKTIRQMTWEGKNGEL